MFGLDKIRADIADLRVAVGLLQANQHSDTHDWWIPKMGCYVRIKRSMYMVMYQAAFGSAPDRPKAYEYRYPDSQEWNDVGPDFTDAIAEIEAEEE